MLNPNDIKIPDTYMQYIMTINAQTMAIYQLMVEKGICTEEEFDRYTEEAKQSINENIKENMEVYAK